MHRHYHQQQQRPEQQQQLQQQQQYNDDDDPIRFCNLHALVRISAAEPEVEFEEPKGKRKHSR
eukprot:2983698-Rhodomonas_salina.1